MTWVVEVRNALAALYGLPVMTTSSAQPETRPVYDVTAPLWEKVLLVGGPQK